MRQEKPPKRGKPRWSEDRLLLIFVVVIVLIVAATFYWRIKSGYVPNVDDTYQP